MKKIDPGVHPLTDPHAQLESSFIEEYLTRLGCDLQDLRSRDDSGARVILKAASTYASGRLAEVEDRAHFIHDIRGTK